MRFRSLLFTAVAVCALFTLSIQLFSQAPPKFYVRWKAGLANVDQSTDAVAQHSGLWSWQGKDNVRDDDFAKLVGPILATNVYFFYSFSQCYGGGMFDELSRLTGSQSGVSASRYNEKASYPLSKLDANTNRVVYTGNGYDFTYSFLRSMLMPWLASEKMASFSAADDPWGQNPNPIPGRMGETKGTEQPIYFAQTEIFITTDSTGAAVVAQPAGQAAQPYEETVPLAPQKNGIAFLWSGQPNLIDQAQTALMIRYLRLLGYPIGRIYVLYGQGKVAPGNPVAQAFAANGVLPNNAFLTDHIRQALKKELSLMLLTVGMKGANYVAFFSTDHGYNTALDAGGAAPREGAGGVPGDAGTPDDTWVGGADADQTPAS